MKSPLLGENASALTVADHPEWQKCFIESRRFMISEEHGNLFPRICCVRHCHCHNGEIVQTNMIKLMQGLSSRI